MTAQPTHPVMTALDLARGYVARGWRPFPIPRGHKKPVTSWTAKVSSEPSDFLLSRWFPPVPNDWNIGLSCRTSGLLVLDEDAAGELDKLCAAFGEQLPSTYTVRTSKGRQLYYSVAEVKPWHYNRTKAAGLDVDIRGGATKDGDPARFGGYVVAAGSLHPDGPLYVAEDEHAEVVPLPEWVDGWLESLHDYDVEPAPGEQTAPRAPAGDRLFTMAQAEAYVREQAQRRVLEARVGQRNEALNDAAFVVGHFVPAFWSYAAAHEALVNLGMRAGLDAVECPATARSGLAAGMRQPYTRVADVVVPITRVQAGSIADTFFDDAAPEADPDAPPEAATEDSWTPRSRERLAEVLQGRKKRAQPSVGAVRQDGARFLYPGKEHALIGEMEAGKSWWALACVAAELVAGRRVAYIHFEESDETDTVVRLADQFQVPHERILDDFLFIGPERAIDPGRVDLLCEDVAPSLVILDGQNEAMALHAQGIYEADGAAAFRQQLVKPWTRHGAAVLSLDHVVKDKERNRDGYAFGSVHKGNGLNGALLMLENTESFGEGRRGVSNLYVTKDRPGSLRKQGRPTKVPRKTFVGQMVIDAEVGTMWSFQFHTPAPAAEDSDEDARERERGARDEVAVLDALKASNARGQYPSKTDLTKGCGIGYQAAREAAARLLVAGRIVQGAPGRPSGLRVAG